MSKITNNIDEAIHELTLGRLVAIPTETVYGLAADASSDKAIEAIYALKKRPFDKALALNIHPSWCLKTWAKDNHELLNNLIKRFWPGPLTIVLPAKSATISKYILGPHHTVAFRCPNHPISLKLLEQFKKPLVAPSANPSHQLSPTTAKQVQAYFKESDLLILDSAPHTSGGLESTIIRLIDNKNYEILRLGAISKKALHDCTGMLDKTPKKTGILPKPQLTIPMFYFTNITQIYTFLNANPLYQNDFLCIANQDLINTLNPPLSLKYPEGELEKHFYNLLHQAQNSIAKVIFIQMTSNINEAIESRIKQFALPIT